MNNPYLAVADEVLSALRDLDDHEHRRQAIALVIASAVAKSENAFRRRVWVLEMPLTFERVEVQGLSNSHEYMNLEMAKAVGFAVLANDHVTQLTRDQDDTKVTFTGKIALLPKSDWNE